MKDVLIFDATMRDGSHALKHQLNLDTISKYCKMIDKAGIYTVIVGHGNGLGASSIQIGLAKHSDVEMLQTAKNSLKNTKLGIYMIPGFGTIKDNLIPAIDCGVDVFKIGCHCTEADVMKEHIEYLSNLSKETYGVLMCSHMAEPKRILEEALKIQSYGAKGIILMDSAGALLDEDVRARISLLKEKTNLKIGFHAHNNLGLAISNTLSALECGAEIIDGTTMGFGAGAGNCQLEVVLAILQKKGFMKQINLYNLMDAADEVIAKDLEYKKGINSLITIGGISGVFSAFTEKVKNVAQIYKIDPRDIFVELGKRKVVGGQEDMIIDVAMNLAQKKKKDATSYMIESLL